MMINRISVPFTAFVQKACPQISGKQYDEAVNMIAMLAPHEAHASDAEIANQINAFLPDEATWKNDGHDPKARVSHLIKVLAACKAHATINGIQDRGHGDSSSYRFPVTARACWNLVKR